MRLGHWRLVLVLRTVLFFCLLVSERIYSGEVALGNETPFLPANATFQDSERHGDKKNKTKKGLDRPGGGTKRKVPRGAA